MNVDEGRILASDRTTNWQRPQPPPACSTVAAFVGKRTTVASPIRVAVVDHDPVFLRLTEQILRSEGYDVILCPSGTKAHIVVASHQPDVVMIDTWLSTHDDGWSLLQTLRLDPETDHIPILLTSSAAEDVRDLAADRTAMRNVLILAKPFASVGLLHAVARLTDPAAKWDIAAWASIDDIRDIERTATSIN